MPTTIGIAHKDVRHRPESVCLVVFIPRNMSYLLCYLLSLYLLRSWKSLGLQSTLFSNCNGTDDVSNVAVSIWSIDLERRKCLDTSFFLLSLIILYPFCDSLLALFSVITLNRKNLEDLIKTIKRNYLTQQLWEEKFWI